MSASGVAQGEEVPEGANEDRKTALTPLWEAMDCPDVTDDPFYNDFN